MHRCFSTSSSALQKAGLADVKYLFETVFETVQALSEMSDLRETLKTVKGRKSFSQCHLIMKTHFSSSFAATWMGCLFHLKKITSREGELTVVFERRVLPYQPLQTGSTVELFTDL